jgi:signal peptidase II
MARIPLSRYVLFAALAIAGCSADLVTKAWAFSLPQLRDGQVLWLWTGHVGVQLSRNWGALFGMGQGMVWLFAALSVAAAIAIPVWLFRFRAAHDVWLTLALGLVMGGVLGNLYDRLGWSAEDWRPQYEQRDPTHAVRDWILWQLNDERRWPNFNIADSLLVVGAGLIFLRIARDPNQERPCDRGELGDNSKAGARTPPPT